MGLRIFNAFCQWGSCTNDTQGSGSISLPIAFNYTVYWKVAASLEMTSVSENYVNVFWGFKASTQTDKGINFNVYRLINGSLSAAIINSVGLFWIAVGV